MGWDGIICFPSERCFCKNYIATNEVRPIKVKNRNTTFKSFYVIVFDAVKKQIVLPVD